MSFTKGMNLHSLDCFTIILLFSLSEFLGAGSKFKKEKELTL